MQTHRTQLASGNPSGRVEWNFRCCFALELPNVYDDIKVPSVTSPITLHCLACSAGKIQCAQKPPQECC